MKRISLIILIISLFCISCSIKKSNDMENKELGFVKLTDLQLIQNVNDYCSENLGGNNFDYALILEHNQVNDTNLIELYYEMNFSTLITDLPLYYSIINDKVIFIKSKLEMYTPDSHENIDTLFKMYFSNQYDYYIKHGEYSPPINFSCEKRKYKNNVLIGTELY